MQKVEGSSPFIRFSEPAGNSGLSVPDRGGAALAVFLVFLLVVVLVLVLLEPRPMQSLLNLLRRQVRLVQPLHLEPGAEEFLPGQLPAFVHLPAIVLYRP